MLSAKSLTPFCCVEHVMFSLGVCVSRIESTLVKVSSNVCKNQFNIMSVIDRDCVP